MTHPKHDPKDATHSAKNAVDTNQHPATDEIPSHLAAKMHQPYPEKPTVQHVNETLTDETPTGYAPHTPGVNIDHPAEVKKAEHSKKH